MGNNNNLMALSDLELLRHAVNKDKLTPLENELTQRFMIMIENDEFEFPEWARALLHDDLSEPSQLN